MPHRTVRITDTRPVASVVDGPGMEYVGTITYSMSVTRDFVMREMANGDVQVMPEDLPAATVADLMDRVRFSDQYVPVNT